HGIADASEAAIAPDATTVRDGSYEPLSRFIYMNVDNSQWHLVRQFLNYGFSAEGQQDVADVGYVPLSAEMHAEMIARMWY
ncbi:MAG: phosphate-binding protein, partial [Candidatus Thermoplasmatota archaeon]|nr:phosphate-binding protein [Candidatus Thermoplasmatota archaeon]